MPTQLAPILGPPLLTASTSRLYARIYERMTVGRIERVATATAGCRFGNRRA